MPDQVLSDADRRLKDYQRALMGFSRIASEPLAPERLMNHAVARIAEVAHINHVKILRYRQDIGDLVLEAGVGWKPGVIGQTMRSDLASPAGRSIQTAMPVVVEDLPNDPEFRYVDILRDHNIVSLLNVPVLIDGRNWGLLEVDSDAPRTFDDGDIAFLTTFANILGIALRCHEAQQLAVAEAERRLHTETRWQTLMAETRHRVKNNFQTIISFLSLQRRQAQTENSRQRFASAMQRVHAIALVHDQLSTRSDDSLVEFGDFIRALCININAADDRIAIEVEASNATLPLDRAVSAGLIVSELITNSVKHAFEGESEAGIIRVLFSVEEERGAASIVVEDNGKGLKGPREGGLGLTIVSSLAEQLSGRVAWETPERGVRVRVTFPLVI